MTRSLLHCGANRQWQQMYVARKGDPDAQFQMVPVGRCRPGTGNVGISTHLVDVMSVCYTQHAGAPTWLLGFEYGKQVVCMNVQCHGQEYPFKSQHGCHQQAVSGPWCGLDLCYFTPCFMLRCNSNRGCVAWTLADFPCGLSRRSPVPSTGKWASPVPSCSWWGTFVISNPRCRRTSTWVQSTQIPGLNELCSHCRRVRLVGDDGFRAPNRAVYLINCGLTVILCDCRCDNSAVREQLGKACIIYKFWEFQGTRPTMGVSVLTQIIRPPRI